MSFCSLARPGFPPLPALPPVFPVAAVVLGFIAWWPIGLALLLLWKGAAFYGWQAARRERIPAWPRRSSGNTAFDEHRAEVLRRLEEERRALDAQQQEFAGFMEQLKRARDREEFDRFMAGRRG
ncbi:DUF2852 domain-containing protein [Siccirubricoccus phaeus]|uniref:DUF2852 domain-containing protein n=1 Tax=Siccirubricoccus phaeus TaxID=2595053 RepID=UPI0011F2041F|nr:DUF2852 domain-containing protein [Siccirubricoccus phaeus]